MTIVASQATSQTSPSTTRPASTAPKTTTGAAADPGWPRAFSTSDGQAVLYQPQIESWDNQTHMVAWSAVSYTRKGATKPDLGTIKIEADTSVALAARLVNFSNLNITESNFTTLSRDQMRQVVEALKTGLPEDVRVIALDRVLTAVDKSTIRPKDVTGVKADPPKIFASTKPAILVSTDGAPIWNPVQGVDLEFVVNTNWDVFRSTQTKAIYLRDGASWLTAAEMTGAWTPAAKLPPSFSKLPPNESFKDVKANVPGKPFGAGAVPAVFVSDTPAELLLLKGVPAYEAVAGTSLLWVNNTESDLFRAGKTGLFYYLVAGRWFSAPDITGPWTFATPALPADFKKIPPEHPRSRVLASVPGTDEATEAVLLAGVPQTARVNKKDLKAPDVEYDGDPKFETIDGTSLERAVNTNKDIVKAGDLYYMCFQAVWFMSRSPNGPWEVTGDVPKEIYSIPPSSPIYNVTYVTVQQSAPNDDWVTFAYVAGYTGMMVAWGCAVWGTGWYYPPYVHYGGAWPVYYGYGRTYGFSAWYNPWTGAYGRGAGVYGPYGGAGAGAVYNPRTGTYARGAAAYGPYGSRATAQAWNPRTGTYAQTRQGSNVYGNWGSSSVQRGDSWAQTGHVTNYATGARTSGVTTGSGAGAVTHTGVAGRTTTAKTASGDMYAGHDGNVYRKQSDGSWQSYDKGSWSGKQPSPIPGNAGTSTIGQLDRDSSARTIGNERSYNADQFQRSPSIQRANTYRGPSGTAFGRGRR